MKSVLVAAISLALAANSVSAQGTADKLLTSNFYPEIETAVPAEKAYAVNTKAMRNFKKQFSDASGDSWYAMKGGYRVKFLQENVYAMADYTRKGDWVCTIKTYGENKLPRAIRNSVRQAYFDHRIFLVQEIKTTQNMVYLVKIEDDHSWMTLRVSDQDIEELEVYEKCPGL